MNSEKTEDQIPEEYRMECPTCGKMLDIRDLGQVLSHGWMNRDTGKYECDPEEKSLPDVTARKVGDPIEWKDGKPTHLN